MDDCIGEISDIRDEAVKLQSEHESFDVVEHESNFDHNKCKRRMTK